MRDAEQVQAITLHHQRPLLFAIIAYRLRTNRFGALDHDELGRSWEHRH